LRDELLARVGPQQVAALEVVSRSAALPPADEVVPAAMRLMTALNLAPGNMA